MSINQANLLGNVGNDPVIRSTQDGKKIATFSLCTSEKWKDKNSNEHREKKEWHNVVIFSEGLANVVEKYVKKGTKLFVQGSIQTRKWTDKSGVEKSITEIVLQGFNNKLEIIDNRDKSNVSENDEGGSYSEPSGIEDEIPF